MLRAPLLIACAAIVSSSTACKLSTAQGPTVALDPDVDDELGGTGVESGDIRGASDQIARALAVAKATGRIVVMPVQNLSRFRVDPMLLQNKLVHDLVQRAKGRYQIVPDDTAGGATPAGELALYTQVRSLTKDNGPTTSDYVQYAFTLRRPADNTVVWAGMFETKRRSDVDVIYQ